MKKIIILILFLLVLPCSKIFASVVISEVCWMGDERSFNNEWIELYNQDSIEQNLIGWVLKTKDGGINIKLNGIMPGKGFFLLEKSNDDAVLEIKADAIYQGALNNNGETLELLNAKGETIDLADFLNGWAFGDNKTKQTMERISDAGWQTSQAPSGTPKSTNSIGNTPQIKSLEQPENDVSNLANRQDLKQKPIATKNIFINEVMPSPDGPDEENEWIELYNANNFEVNLRGWKIKDTVGSIKIFTLKENSIIPAFGYLILMRPQTKISLQNTGDGVELLNASGEIIDKTEFSKAKENQSWAKNENNWSWTLALTPGKPNIIKIESANSKNKNFASSSLSGLKANLSGASINLNKQNSPYPKSAPSKIINFVIGLLVAIVATAIALLIYKKFPEEKNME